MRLTRAAPPPVRGAFRECGVIVYTLPMTSKAESPPRAVVRHVDLRYFAIVLLPIAIFAMEGVITDHMMPRAVLIPPDIVNMDHPWLEIAGRYRFLAASWFFGAFAVLAAALVVRTLLRPLSVQTRVVSVGTWLFVIALALLPTVTGDDAGPPTYRWIGSEVFETALSQGTLAGCAGPDDRWLLGRCGPLPAVTLFNRVLDIINFLAGLGIGALIVGMILCLNRGRAASVEDEAAVLADNFKQMRQQLYLSSLVLTLGMFFATSWMHWPMPMVTGDARSAYGTLILSTALFTGTYFTLLILSFYLPVAVLLDGRARDLARRKGRSGDGEAPQDADAWLASHGLKEGVGDYLKAGFALAAPVLTAFAGGISPLQL